MKPKKVKKTAKAITVLVYSIAYLILKRANKDFGIFDDKRKEH